MTLKWWSNPPAAIHQRIVSSRDERHASLATLVFCVVQFAVNYWPMIMIALVSLVVFPELEPGLAEHGYPMLIVELMPAGLLGLMLASMMAAFMSTIDTHINFGAAFMVNDIYRRFLKKDATEQHYVRASRLSTLLMLAIAVVVAYSLDSVSQAWYFLAMLIAGYGFLTIARWFWWRINAWGEIAALLGSGLTSVLVSLRFAAWAGYGELMESLSYGWRFCIVVLVSTLAWVTVTLLTPPSTTAKLVEFCRKVKPFPQFWGPIARDHPEIDWNPDLGPCLAQWVAGSAGVFALCFAIGNAIFARWSESGLLLALAVGCALVVAHCWRLRTSA